MRSFSIPLFAYLFVPLWLMSCAPYSGGKKNVREGWMPSPYQTAETLQMREMPSKLISFSTDEGTFMSLDVSHDGEMLVFDLLGDLYLIPMKGGTAIPLTSGRAWDQAPLFSLNGDAVYFVSDRSDTKGLWRVSLPDRTVNRVSTEPINIMGSLNWTPDGSHILAGISDAETNNTESSLFGIDIETGKENPLEEVSGPWIDMNTFQSLRERNGIYSGDQSKDGQVFFSEVTYDNSLARSVVRIYRFDPEAKKRFLITPRDADYNEFKPQLSNNGKSLAYFRQYNNRRTELRLRNLDNGADRAIVDLVDADDASYFATHDSWPRYTFTPDDQHVVFWQAGKLHKVDINTSVSDIIPFQVNVEREVWDRVKPGIQTLDDTGEATTIRWPSLTPNGKSVVFAAIGYIWVMDLETGLHRRLTDSSDFEYTPSLSPDGRSVAYVSFAKAGDDDEYGPGKLMIATIDGSTRRELLSAHDSAYLLPKWSRDGQKIALIRETRTQYGPEAVYGWAEATHGSFREVASAPALDDRWNTAVYARHLGFDENGESLLFGHRISRTDSILFAANLDGTGKRTLAIGKGVAGITPSIDLKHLALTGLNDTLWVVPFEVSDSSVEVSVSSPDARRVSVNGGYYANWVGAAEITYGLGKNLYRYDLDRGALKTRQIELPFHKLQTSRSVVFTGARLITISGSDGVGQVIEGGTVVIDGRRITNIGLEDEVRIPADAVVIDVKGKTIMPGLLDTHYHGISMVSLSPLKLPPASFDDRSAIAYGVTTAWSLTAPLNDGSSAIADLQESGRVFGPRWSHASGDAVGRPYEELDSYGEAWESVWRLRELGASTLKEYMAPSRTHRQWFSTAAGQQGLGVVSHIDNFDMMMTRIVDGYTGGDHPYIPVPFYKDVSELLRQTGYIWTPNIVITVGTIASGVGGLGADVDRYYWRAVLKKRPQELDKLDATTSQGRDAIEISKPSVPYEKHRVSRIATQAAMAAKAGVQIGVSAHNKPASRLHQEMWYLWKGGMALEDILRTATIGNAEKLGLQEEVGSLEVGKIADFLVLDENPLDDIINTLSLKYTVQGGLIYNSDTAQRLSFDELD